MVHTHHGGLKVDRGVQDLDQNSCPCIDDRIDWNNEKFHKTEPNFNSQPFCVCVHYKIKTRLTSDQKCWKDLQISDRQTTSTILKYNCRLEIKADQDLNSKYETETRPMSIWIHGNRSMGLSLAIVHTIHLLVLKLLRLST